MRFPEENLLEWGKSRLRAVNLGQVIVLICVVALSVWCAINVQHIFLKFANHDTIISLENNPPVKTPFPGITICAPSIFKPQTLANYFPEFKKKFDSYEKWRRFSDEPDKELHDKSNQSLRRELFLQYEAKALQKFRATRILRELSVQQEDLLEDCEFHPMNIRTFQLAQTDDGLRPKARKCADIVPLLESIYEGKKCFTYFSDLHHDDTRESNLLMPATFKVSPQPEAVSEIVQKDQNSSQLGKKSDAKTGNYSNSNAIQVDLANCELDHSCGKDTSGKMSEVFYNSDTTMVFDLNPSIEVRIKAIERDIWVSYVSDSIIMTVHPPNILQNRRDFLFFQVMRNNFYEIAFTKKTTYLMRPPYKTMCIEYLEDSEFRKYITRDSCITYCILDQVSSAFCANYYGVLIEEMFTNKLNNYTMKQICAHDNQNYSSYLEARNKCEKHCPAECTKTIFEISGQVRNPYEDNCDQWWNVSPNSENDREPVRDLAPDDTDLYYGFDSDDSMSVADEFDSQEDALSLARRSTYLSLLRWGHTLKGNLSLDTYFSSDESASICQSARVSIRISPKPFTTVRHQAAITWEGFLGTVGGHIGIWLGLSLYKIIKFAVHILYNLLHRLVRSSSDRCGPTIA